MKKYLIFALLFCSVPAFSVIPCSQLAEKITKIVLAATNESYNGTLYLKNNIKIKVNYYTNSCYAPTVITKPSEMLPGCAIFLYEKQMADGGLSYGCRCFSEDDMFLCLVPSNH